jgi:GNAT superfamily N-acetyltransferase
VERAGTPGRVRRNTPDSVPVILLSRPAIDREEQGKGLGAQLLRDAITRAVAAAEIIGVRALLVHALHGPARTFHAHFDFEPSPTDPLHLLLLIKDARALLDPSQRDR